MKKTTIKIVIGLFILGSLGCSFIFLNKIIKFAQSEVDINTIIEFTATVTETPQPTEEPGEFNLVFNDVSAVDHTQQENLAVFANGGACTVTLTADEKIQSGDKVTIILHENFATTHSIPAKIIGNSVIDVAF